MEIEFYGTILRSKRVVSTVCKSRDNKLIVTIGFEGNPDAKLHIGLIELRELMKNVEENVVYLGRE